MKPEIRLAGFDMDGTVLQHNSSWVAIHKHFGTEREGEASLRLYTEGKIDYLEFMRRDISSWPRGVTREELVNILSRYKIRSEAPKVFDKLRDLGIKTALVTSGIDLLAEEVTEKLGIDHCVANGLRFDKRGGLLPSGVGRVDPTRKDVAYKKLLSKLGIPGKKTLAVGDTIYDLAFLKLAGLGFMMSHAARISDPSIIHIERLTEIFEHF